MQHICQRTKLRLGIKSEVDGLPGFGAQASHVTTKPQFLSL